jgi:hypothetical protein
MDSAGSVVLTLRFRQENRRWTGECVELGTATYGRTLRQTHDELVELVALHLDAFEATGERERFFRTHGIRFYADNALPAEITTSAVCSLLEPLPPS